jgi:hypothetical protein
MDDYVEIELPDGSIVEFPSSMPPQDISNAIRKMLAPRKPESLLEQITRGPRNVAAGINKLAHNVVNIPSNVAGELGFPKASEALSFNKDFDIDKFWGLPEEKTWTDILAQSAPEIVAGMAVPGLALGRAGQALSKLPAGKYLEKIISEAIPQAGVAALFAPNENRGEAAATAGIAQAPFSALSQLAMSTKPEYQKIASLLGGALGGIAGGAGLSAMGAPDYISAPAGLALGALGAKGLGTKGMMMQELAGGKNAPLANERLAAANRIGLDFLTPSEAFNSPYLGRKQGRLGRTEEGSEMMYDKFQSRAESEAAAIDKLLNEIHNPEVMGPLADSLYNEAYSTEFFPDYLESENNILSKDQLSQIYEDMDKFHVLPVHEHFQDSHLKDVIKEMEKLGAPTIRAYALPRALVRDLYRRLGPGDVYQAIEGSHRIRAAKELGLTPKIEVLDELTPFNDLPGMDYEGTIETINEIINDESTPISFLENEGDYKILENLKSSQKEKIKTNNEIINSAIKNMHEKPAFREKLKNIDRNSIEYWDQVKKSLDDMMENSPKEEASLIRREKNKLVRKMDEISPEYKEARALEERKFARQTLEKAFDKTNINSGAAFFKALRSKKDFDKLMHNLRNVPEAQEKLKDMRELFKDFRDISTVKRVTGLEQVGMKQDRNDFAALKHAFENMFTKGKFDKEAIEFITSKNWDKQLQEINKITDRQKRMAKIIEVFGKGVAQASAKKEPWLVTAEGQEIYD